MSRHARTPAGGFSMIEVLITMFLVAIAMLGSAALQAYSLKVNQGSQFRAQAVILGADLLERIEANNVAAIAGAYAGTLPLNGAGTDCAAMVCTPAQVAQHDLARLDEALARQLPEGAAVIAFSGAGPFTYTVQITWRERATRPTTAEAKTEAFAYTVSRTIYDRASTL